MRTIYIFVLEIQKSYKKCSFQCQIPIYFRDQNWFFSEPNTYSFQRLKTVLIRAKKKVLFPNTYSFQGSKTVLLRAIKMIFSEPNIFTFQTSKMVLVRAMKKGSIESQRSPDKKKIYLEPRKLGHTVCQDFFPF